MLNQCFGVHGTGSEQSQTAGIAHSGGQSPAATPHHSALYDGILYTEKFANSVHKVLFLFVLWLVLCSCQGGFAVSEAAFHVIMSASSGMLTTDRTVERNVPWVITVVSLLYFMQNIVPKEATGMPISTALMASICASTPKRRNR